MFLSLSDTISPDSVDAFSRNFLLLYPHRLCIIKHLVFEKKYADAIYFSMQDQMCFLVLITTCIFALLQVGDLQKELKISELFDSANSNVLTVAVLPHFVACISIIHCKPINHNTVSQVILLPAQI